MMMNKSSLGKYCIMGRKAAQNRRPLLHRLGEFGLQELEPQQVPLERRQHRQSALQQDQFFRNEQNQRRRHLPSKPIADQLIQTLTHYHSVTSGCQLTIKTPILQ